MSNYLNGVGKNICGHCSKHRTLEGYDGCIGYLPNVRNACCGHGEDRSAYVQFNHEDYQNKPNKYRITGKEALEYIEEHKTIKT